VQIADDLELFGQLRPADFMMVMDCCKSPSSHGSKDAQILDEATTAVRGGIPDSHHITPKAYTGLFDSRSLHRMVGLLRDRNVEFTTVTCRIMLDKCERNNTMGAVI
jgi:hypothetical protein